MARKRRFPYTCFTCGKRFRNAQAVRGHRRHCRDLRLTRQAEAQAGAQPVSPTAQHNHGFRTRGHPQSSGDRDAVSMGRRPGPLSYETKLLLLEVQAAIEQLHHEAGHFAFWAHELTRMNVKGHDTPAQAWWQIYHGIDDCLRELDPMLPSFQVNRGTIHLVYTTMRRLKVRWLEQRISERRLVETEPDGLDPWFRLVLREEEACLIRIVEDLKRLVAGVP
jgi:hypothetical protein